MNTVIIPEGGDGRPLVVDEGTLITNKGPSTVYYKSSKPVTASDSSIASAATARLEGTQWFYVASGSATLLFEPKKPSSPTSTAKISFPGTLTAVSAVAHWIAPRAVEIVSVTTVCDTAPTGATLIVDVNADGTTIFTTQANRPTIAISGKTSAAKTPDVRFIAAGTVISFDVDQVGSTIAGADLDVILEIR